MLDVESRSPDCTALFFPFEKEMTKIGSNATPSSMDTHLIDARDDIIDCQTNKPKGGLGTFTVLLGSGKNYKAMLHPGAWCMIYMKDSELPATDQLDTKEDSGFKMLGIIRTVRRKEVLDPQTGIRMVRYLVAGEDFHSVFNTQIYINANLTEIAKKKNASITAALLILGERFENTMTPSQMVQALIDSLLGRPAFIVDKKNAITKSPAGGRTGQPYKVPANVARRVLGFKHSGSAGDFFTGMLTTVLQEDLVGMIQVKPNISGTVSVWSLLQAYCHRLLNELYTDLLPINVYGEVRLVPSIVLRAVPFSSQNAPDSIHKSAIPFIGPGKKIVAVRSGGKAILSQPSKKTKNKIVLPQNKGAHYYISKEIYENEIRAFDSGKTDRERFNFFFIVNNMTENQTNEIAQLETIVKNGNLSSVGDLESISRYGLRPFIAYSNYMIPGKGKDSFTINELIRDIWHDAYLFESGQVVIYGSREHIPVGTNIVFKERDWIAHVEKVDHIFSVNQETGIKSFMTSISFVRLQNIDGSPIDSIGDTSKSKFEEPIIGAFDRGVSVKREP